MKSLLGRPAALAGFFAAILLTLGAAAAMQSIYSGHGLSDDPEAGSETIYPNF